MATKFLITLGLVLLLVTPYCLAETEEEEKSEEVEESESAESEEEEEEAPNSAEGSAEKSESNEEEDEERREDENVPRGKYVSSEGTEKKCDEHPDCYDQREPSDWCLLKPDQKWTDKGCFCSSNGKCVIERQTGNGYEHTDCSPREGWECKYD